MRPVRLSSNNLEKSGKPKFRKKGTGEGGLQYFLPESLFEALGPKT
ncbi:MAG: hypothetical protein PHE01_08175 [Methanosarcina sp.]|nr:hypothetical protein [Methanosarcina sp.]